MPSAPASFACCDRCTASGAARSGARPFGPQLSGASNLSGSQLCGATTTTATAQAGVLAAHLAPADARLSADPAMVARRRLLKAAVFRRAPDLSGISRPLADPAGAELGAEQVPAGRTAAPAAAESARAGRESAIGPSAAAEAWHTGFADSDQLPRTVWGTVLDVSPHVLVIGDAEYEQRFTLTPDAVAWRGRLLEPAALRQDDNVVVRLHPGHRDVADRIWANIGRVTGVIAECSADGLLIDEGATREPQLVVLHRQAAGRIQVRFPTLEPGFLVDIIGRRRGDELVGLIPATSQPGYPAARIPAAPLVNGRVPRVIAGSATWHEPRNEVPGVLGADYPALDPETGCAEDAVTGLRQGYARMPYLAIGSLLRIRNDCTGSHCLVPVTGCASIARLFNDRCVTCGTSPRGRVVDLTMASFIALGGELERGCFNATVSMGE
ncbi:MAG: hypothetical protein ACRDOK_15190 [Streptosporangiaceae bacterium]